MKKILKWLGITLLTLCALAFLAFLYFIPPFTTMAPEAFSGPAGKAGPDLSMIADPAERMLAERGHYLVTMGSCSDCHSTPGPEGPRAGDMYLAGGSKAMRKNHGTYISINLTSDKATGVGNWPDEDLKRVWRNGLAPDGRAIPGHLMPWPAFSQWTDEDMHAVIVYLRHVTPIAHPIPKPILGNPALTDSAAFEEGYAGADYAVQ